MPLEMETTDSAIDEGGDGIFEISNSFEEVNERNYLLGWNIQYLQLRPREYAGTLAGVDVGDSTLVVERIDVPTEMVGEFQGNQVAVFFASAPANSGVYSQNHDFCTSAFLLNLGGEVDVITADNTQIGQLYIPAETFYRSWEMLAPGLNLFQFGHYGFIDLPPGYAQSCYWHIQRIVSGGYATEQLRAEYVSTVLAQLAIRAQDGRADCRQRPQAAARARALTRARDFIETHLDGSVLLPEVCNYGGVSMSTLSRLFREYYGMSPAAYIRVRRMHKCRELLQNTSPAEKSVAEAMRDCGVRHPGRFASEYKQFFGETPKQALGYLTR